MKDTEKIEIMNFDQDGYLEDGRNVYEAGKKMTALADRVHEEGSDAVFLMGVGGTGDAFMQPEYTMFIGSGALWGETILYSLCLLEEMQWKRIRHITSHDFFHGSLELLAPGVPVFLFMGEDECRALDERVRAFLTSGVTGDEDYVIIDTAEYGIPGLDDDFRVIVSPWILSALTTDRLARNYEMVTKHNLKYRRYYHQFDY